MTTLNEILPYLAMAPLALFFILGVFLFDELKAIIFLLFGLCSIWGIIILFVWGLEQVIK